MSNTVNSRWLPAETPLGSTNAVLVARSRRHTVREFPGPLSIKTVLEGRVAWTFARRTAWVDRESFLILHDGEPYSMAIDEDRPVATCCAFFARGFVETVARDLGSRHDPLLDNPQSEPFSLNFPTQFHPLSPGMRTAMRQAHQVVTSGLPTSATESLFIALAGELLREQNDARTRMENIASVRSSTRAELLARVSRGREYLHSADCATVTLQAAARVAGMSFFHFHRTFAQAFGQPPARYIAGLRFKRAAALLRQGVPVTDVCHTVGYSSLGSFSAAFHRHHGCPPSSLLS